MRPARNPNHAIAASIAAVAFAAIAATNCGIPCK